MEYIFMLYMLQDQMFLQKDVGKIICGCVCLHACMHVWVSVCFSPPVLKQAAYTLKRLPMGEKEKRTFPPSRNISLKNMKKEEKLQKNVAHFHHYQFCF